MKNLHILPTDKYSDLVHSTNKYGGYFLSKYYSPMKEMGDSYQNIYITNDEEIKEGDWVLNPIYKTVYQWLTNADIIFDRIDAKKIILTTDKDLIKDGVQAIDDEFLEWFVKNPSCEEVEVEPFHGIKTSVAEINAVSGDGSLKWRGRSDLRDYKIIIPKEEIKSIKAKIEDFVENCREDHLDRLLPKEEPKQETFEDKLDRIVSKEPSKFLEESEKRMEAKAKLFRYSEEEVGKIAKDAYAMGRKGLLIGVFNKWFEQFKNK